MKNGLVFQRGLREKLPPAYVVKVFKINDIK